MKIRRFIFPAGDQPARVYHARRLLLVGALSMSVGMVAVTPWREGTSAEAAPVRTPVLTLPGPPTREIGPGSDQAPAEPPVTADDDHGTDGSDGDSEGDGTDDGGAGIEAVPAPSAAPTQAPVRPSTPAGRPASGGAQQPTGTTSKPSCPARPQPSKPSPNPTPPTATPPPANSGTLKAGDSGPRVSRLQQFLFLQGFTFVRVTGTYDDATVRGVAKLQSDRGITGDPSGVFGPNTAARVGAF